MLRENFSIRNFKGGSWDLRKNDRRKAQSIIAFPDRRANNRRTASKSDDRVPEMDSLEWVTKSVLDE
jgi:hypothetical protein